MPLLLWMIGLYFSYIGRTDAETFKLEDADVLLTGGDGHETYDDDYYGEIFMVSKNFTLTYEPTIVHGKIQLHDVTVITKLEDLDILINVYCNKGLENDTYKVYIKVDNIDLQFFNKTYNCNESQTIVKLGLTSSKKYTITVNLSSSGMENMFNFQTPSTRLIEIELHILPNLIFGSCVFRSNLNFDKILQLFEYNMNTGILTEQEGKVFYIEGGEIRARNILPGTHYLLRISGPTLYKTYNIIMMTLNVPIPIYLDYSYNEFYIRNLNSESIPSTFYNLFIRTDVTENWKFVPLPNSLHYNVEERGTLLRLKIHNIQENFKKEYYFVSDFVGGIGFLESVRTDKSLYVSWKRTVKASYLTMVNLELIKCANYKNTPYTRTRTYDENYKTIYGLESSVDYVLRICLHPRHYFCLKDRYSIYYKSYEHCRERYINKFDFKVEMLAFSKISIQKKIFVHYNLGTKASSESRLIYVYGAKNVKSLLLLEHYQINVLSDSTDDVSNIFIKLASKSTTEIESKLTVDIPVKSSLVMEFLQWVYAGYPYFISIVICQGQFCYQSSVHQLQNTSDLVLFGYYIVIFCSIFAAAFFNMICIYVIFIQSKIGYVKLHLKDTLKLEATNNLNKTKNSVQNKHISQIDSCRNSKFVEKRHIYPVNKDFVGSDERGYIFRVINRKMPIYRKKKISLEGLIRTSVFILASDALQDKQDKDITDPSKNLEDSNNYALLSSGYIQLPCYSHQPELVNKVNKEGIKLHAAYVPGLYGPASYMIGTFALEYTGIDFFDLLFDHQVQTVVLLCGKQANPNSLEFKHIFDANRKGLQKWNFGDDSVLTLCIKSSHFMNIFLCRIDKEDETNGGCSTVETRIFQYNQINSANNISNINSFIDFRKHVRDYHCMSKYPLLALCDTGFGLSAFFITIDYNFQLIEAESEFVNVSGFMDTLLEIIGEWKFKDAHFQQIVRVIRNYLTSTLKLKG